jgi:C4-dicarboxylate-binding protein DctP
MKFRFALASITAALLAAGVASAQPPIVIKFSHVVAPKTPKGKGAEKFKELAEKRLPGRIKIEVYPNSQLYKDGEELDALLLGSVQMLAPSLAKFGPLGVRAFEVFDLPYLFDSYDQVHEVTTGRIGQALFAKLEPKGVVGLAYWDNGFKILSANRPLKSPADVEGLKMRIQPSKVIEAQMRRLGALPQAMAFSEVRQALRTGLVDGTENPPSNLYTQNMHEVQHHVTVTEHGYLGYAVIANKPFWDGLPPDVRQELEAAMKEATGYANTIAKQENDRALEKIKVAGTTQVYVPTVPERAAWKKAMVPVHQEMASRIGADTIQAVYAETGFKPD